MYFEDLSPYVYFIPKCVPDEHKRRCFEGLLNVGWLENGYPFETGSTSWRFRSRLRKLARNPVRAELFGHHECDLCEGNGPKATGTGEIEVSGPDGSSYTAPVLIVHYVSKHNYLPPQEFIDAVLMSGR